MPSHIGGYTMGVRNAKNIKFKKKQKTNPARLNFRVPQLERLISTQICLMFMLICLIYGVCKHKVIPLFEEG